MEIDFLKTTEFLKATETAHVGNICIHHARGEVGCLSEALIKIVKIFYRMVFNFGFYFDY